MNNKELREIAKQVDFETVLNFCDIGVTRTGHFCCPFHKNGNERHPSARINYNKNKGCCFVCKNERNQFLTFDTIDLVIHCKNVDYKTAIKILIELSGKKIDMNNKPYKRYEIRADENSSKDVTDKLKKCVVMQKYQKDYLNNRGIYLEDRNGYKGIKDILIKNNIAIYHKYEFNCNKIVYHFKHDDENCPYYETSNEPFLIIKKTDCFDNEAIPKAMNYGSVYPKFIFVDEKQKDIYICEGIEDALSMVQAGRNAVTINSANNVDRLIEVFEDNSRLSNYKFIIATDMDEKGIECKEALIEYFEENRFKYDTFKPLEIMFEQQGIKDVNDLWKLKLGLKK